MSKSDKASDGKFPTLSVTKVSVGTPIKPPTNRPVMAFTLADKVKKQLEIEAIAAAAKKVEETRAAVAAAEERAAKLAAANIPTRLSIIRSTDESDCDRDRESPEYDSTYEYEERTSRFKGVVIDYSKDLSDDDYEERDTSCDDYPLV